MTERGPTTTPLAPTGAPDPGFAQVDELLKELYRELQQDESSQISLQSSEEEFVSAVKYSASNPPVPTSSANDKSTAEPQMHPEASLRLADLASRGSSQSRERTGEPQWQHPVVHGRFVPAQMARPRKRPVCRSTEVLVIPGRQPALQPQVPSYPSSAQPRLEQLVERYNLRTAAQASEASQSSSHEDELSPSSAVDRYMNAITVRTDTLPHPVQLVAEIVESILEQTWSEISARNGSRTGVRAQLLAAASATVRLPASTAPVTSGLPESLRPASSSKTRMSTKTSTLRLLSVSAVHAGPDANFMHSRSMPATSSLIANCTPCAFGPDTDPVPLTNVLPPLERASLRPDFGVVSRLLDNSVAARELTLAGLTRDAFLYPRFVQTLYLSLRMLSGLPFRKPNFGSLMQNGRLVLPKIPKGAPSSQQSPAHSVSRSALRTTGPDSSRDKSPAFLSLSGDTAPALTRNGSLTSEDPANVQNPVVASLAAMSAIISCVRCPQTGLAVAFTRSGIMYAFSSSLNSSRRAEAKLLKVIAPFVPCAHAAAPVLLAASQPDNALQEGRAQAFKELMRVSLSAAGIMTAEMRSTASPPIDSMPPPGMPSLSRQTSRASMSSSDYSATNSGTQSSASARLPVDSLRLPGKAAGLNDQYSGGPTRRPSEARVMTPGAIDVVAPELDLRTLASEQFSDENFPRRAMLQWLHEFQSSRSLTNVVVPRPGTAASIIDGNVNFIEPTSTRQGSFVSVGQSSSQNQDQNQNQNQNQTRRTSISPPAPVSPPFSRPSSSHKNRAQSPSVELSLNQPQDCVLLQLPGMSFEDTLPGLVEFKMECIGVTPLTGSDMHESEYTYMLIAATRTKVNVFRLLYRSVSQGLQVTLEYSLTSRQFFALAQDTDYENAVLEAEAACTVSKNPIPPTPHRHTRPRSSISVPSNASTLAVPSLGSPAPSRPSSAARPKTGAPVDPTKRVIQRVFDDEVSTMGIRNLPYVMVEKPRSNIDDLLGADPSRVARGADAEISATAVALAASAAAGETPLPPVVFTSVCVSSAWDAITVTATSYGLHAPPHICQVRCAVCSEGVGPEHACQGDSASNTVTIAFKIDSEGPGERQTRSEKQNRATGRFAHLAFLLAKLSQGGVHEDLQRWLEFHRIAKLESKTGIASLMMGANASRTNHSPLPVGLSGEAGSDTQNIEGLDSTNKFTAGGFAPNVPPGLSSTLGSQTSIADGSGLQVMSQVPPKPNRALEREKELARRAAAAAAHAAAEVRQASAQAISAVCTVPSLDEVLDVQQPDDITTLLVASVVNEVERDQTEDPPAGQPSDIFVTPWLATPTSADMQEPSNMVSLSDLFEDGFVGPLMRILLQIDRDGNPTQVLDELRMHLQSKLFVFPATPQYQIEKLHQLGSFERPAITRQRWLAALATVPSAGTSSHPARTRRVAESRVWMRKVWTLGITMHPLAEATLKRSLIREHFVHSLFITDNGSRRTLGILAATHNAGKIMLTPIGTPFTGTVVPRTQIVPMEDRVVCVATKNQFLAVADARGEVALYSVCSMPERFVDVMQVRFLGYINSVHARRSVTHMQLTDDNKLLVISKDCQPMTGQATTTPAPAGLQPATLISLHTFGVFNERHETVAVRWAFESLMKLEKTVSRVVPIGSDKFLVVTEDCAAGPNVHNVFVLDATRSLFEVALASSFSPTPSHRLGGTMTLKEKLNSELARREFNSIEGRHHWISISGTTAPADRYSTTAALMCATEKVGTSCCLMYSLNRSRDAADVEVTSSTTATVTPALSPAVLASAPHSYVPKGTTTNLAACAAPGTLQGSGTVQFSRQTLNAPPAWPAPAPTTSGSILARPSTMKARLGGMTLDEYVKRFTVQSSSLSGLTQSHEQTSTGSGRPATSLTTKRPMTGQSADRAHAAALEKQRNNRIPGWTGQPAGAGSSSYARTQRSSAALGWGLVPRPQTLSRPAPQQSTQRPTAVVQR